jgi:hypothetical protein
VVEDTIVNEQAVKGVVLRKNRKYLRNDIHPYPAASEGPLAQRHHNVDVAKALKGPATDELGHSHGSPLSRKPRWEPVEDKSPGLEDGETLGGNGTTEKENSRGLERVVVARERLIDPFPSPSVISIDLSIVPSVER